MIKIRNRAPWVNIKHVRLVVLVICTLSSFNCRIPNAFTGETIAFKWENMRLSETDFITEDDIILDDSILIVRSSSHTIYKLHSHETESTVNLDKNLDIISEEFTTTPKPKYFVHKNNETQGSLYDSINATNYRIRMLVDSFLIKHVFKNSTFDKLENYTQISAIGKKDNSTETYVPNDKTEHQADTIYLSFSKKLKDLKYSFSLKLDSLRDSKLFQVKYVYNPIPPRPGEVYIPRLQYFFELKKTDISDQALLKELIKVNDRLINSKEPVDSRKD